MCFLKINGTLFGKYFFSFPLSMFVGIQFSDYKTQFEKEFCHCKSSQSVWNTGQGSYSCGKNIQMTLIQFKPRTTLSVSSVIICVDCHFYQNSCKACYSRKSISNSFKYCPLSPRYILLYVFQFNSCLCLNFL